MNNNNVNNEVAVADLSKSLPPGLARDLGELLPQSTDLGSAGLHVENVAFHDFATYEYIFDLAPTEESFSFELTDIELSEAEKQTVDYYLAKANIPESEQELVIELCTFVVGVYRQVLKQKQPGYPAAAELTLIVLIGFMKLAAPALYRTYASLDCTARMAFVQKRLVPFLRRFGEDDPESAYPTSPTGADWDSFIESLSHPVKEDGALKFHPAGEVNFGLRIIYRQEWRTLGDQNGELVRTIPLGPRQSEKVSIKVLRRNKGTRQLERTTATETTTETADSTKDSSEIVEEAARTTKSHVDGEAGYSGFGFSARVSAGYSEENAQKSSEAKKKLSETMQKTANKMRRETKVAVSTESEETFEETRASELVNPNDEIALTLAYNRLQRAYEVHTYLAEVASVVFVAEQVPEIDDAWVQRYDWILAKVLLDDSFRNALEWLSRKPRPASLSAVDSPETNLKTYLTEAKESIGKVGAMSGSITNIYDSAVEGYRAAAAEALARQTEQATMARDVNRLKQHIQDNILHYCRAVWSSEDPDARMLRYMNVYVPAKVEWQPEAQSGGSEVPAKGKLPGLAHPFIQEQIQEGAWKISGDPQDFVRLSDVVNPAGPIDFFGNYAVFHIKNGADIGLNQALTYYRLKYAEPGELFVLPAVNSGSAKVIGKFEMPWLVGYHPYRLLFRKGTQPGSMAYSLRVSTGGASDQLVREGSFSGSKLIIDVSAQYGFKLIVEGSPSDGDQFTIVATQPKLCDPELTLLKQQYPVPDIPELRAKLFDEKLVGDMLDLMPGLRSTLERMEVSEDNGGGDAVPPTWETLNAAQRECLVSRYHDFLLRREHTRRFVVDTNSLVLNVLAGSGSALEPFKRAHRFLDVVKAATEVERRKALITHEEYGDPDIERVVVVAGDGSHLAGLVAGAELKESGDKPGKAGSPENR